MGYDLLSRNVYCLKEGAVDFCAHPAATEVANTNRISSNSLCFMTRNILVYVY